MGELRQGSRALDQGDERHLLCADETGGSIKVAAIKTFGNHDC